MKKIIITLIIITGLLPAQTFKVKNITGDVKAQIGISEKWQPVKVNQKLNSSTTLMTSNKSKVVLQLGKQKIILKYSSIVSLKGIKKLTTDELLLALAMENLIDVPSRKKNINNSPNTAVYGKEINGKVKDVVNTNDFGTMRLNGAKQLAENGYVESAIIEAMETYRKYPDTKHLSVYRIYFADLLVKKNLYDEALTEYNKIIKFKLSTKEKLHVTHQMTFLKKKLLK